MTEKDKEIRETINEISYNIINDIAPEEIDMFEEISEAYFSDPAVFEKKKSGDDPIGFGIEGIMEMFSPAVMTVVTTVVTYIATEAFGAAKGALTDELKAKIKSLFNKKAEKKDDAALTPEQLKTVHEKAVSRGISLNLSEEQANNLANALIASMVIKQ